MRKLLLVIVLAALVQMPMVLADFETSYSVMPGRGAYNEKFYIWVRAEPLVETEQMFMSVFFDGSPLAIRLPSPAYMKSKTMVEHRWDRSFSPPARYNEEGKHKIEIWLEKSSGDLEILRWQYTITEGGLPEITAWDNYVEKHPEILRQLTGPEGPIGPIGIGERGPRGEIGETGSAGKDGDIGLTGADGAIGVTGATGPEGETGTFSVTQVFFVCILSSIITLCVLYGLLELGLFSTVIEAKLRISEEK